MYFLGTFDYAMDERGRVPLPPRYRDAFREGIVLSQGSPDHCIRVSTQTSFKEQALAHTAESPLHRTGRDLRRVLFPRTYEVELDKQNRVLLPAPLRDWARLTGKVLVLGIGEWVEIWSPEEYDAEMTRVDAQIETTMESIEIRDR